jgi:glycosyltransferase involved in cell wall biosynthesis
MNICIISSWLPSNKRPNFSPFVYNFAVNLSKFGINVSVICPQENGDKSIMHQDSMTIYRVNRRFPLFPIYRLIDKIKPDIIHVHAPNLFSCNAIPVAKFKKIPILATVHRAEIDTLRNPMFFLRKHALARFERVISVSNYTKSLALRAGVDGNKICIIHNSCNEVLFCHKDKVVARINCRLPSDKKIVLFVGNLIKIKGVYTLIESLKILCSSIPELLLLIIGQGEEREKLESLASSYGLNSNIKFLGWVPQKDLPELYNAADIFVLPSITEGHSVALLEAMAVGLPIVASGIGGNIETIEDGVNGFHFETGNTEKLAERLMMILTNRNLRRMMSENSSKIYLEKFSTNNQINSHLKVYNSIMDKKLNYNK